MPDFTSALYLGFEHPWAVLAPWDRLTLGAPAALTPPPEERTVGRSMSRLLGLQAAMTARSTLHLFHDLAELVRSERGWRVFIDRGAYPIARWAFEASQPVEVAHYDPTALRRALDEIGGQRPIVLADGICPACGKVIPAKEYLWEIERRAGLLVLDDTQGLGILGKAPSLTAPWGRGGGGTACWTGVSPTRHLLVVASLAKAFGVPLAVLAGDRSLVRRLSDRGATRVHMSSPSAADLAAARRALALHRSQGETRRRHLRRVIERFREKLAVEGWNPSGGLLPVQILPPLAGVTPSRLHHHLHGSGVRALLVRPRCSPSPAVTLLWTASHGSRDVDTVLRALRKVRRFVPALPQAAFGPPSA